MFIKAVRSALRSPNALEQSYKQALTLAFCSCSSALVLTAGICRSAVRVGGYPHLVRCGGRRRSAEFRLVQVEDTLQNGDDTDGIGVDGQQRLSSGSENLDFQLALRSHRREIRVGSASVAANKIPEPPCCCQRQRGNFLDFSPVRNESEQVLSITYMGKLVMNRIHCL